MKPFASQCSVLWFLRTCYLHRCLQPTKQTSFGSQFEKRYRSACLSCEVWPIGWTSNMVQSGTHCSTKKVVKKSQKKVKKKYIITKQEPRFEQVFVHNAFCVQVCSFSILLSRMILICKELVFVYFFCQQIMYIYTLPKKNKVTWNIHSHTFFVLSLVLLS